MEMEIAVREKILIFHQIKNMFNNFGVLNMPYETSI